MEIVKTKYLPKVMAAALTFIVLCSSAFAGIINSATFTVGDVVLVNGGTVALQSTIALSLDVVVPDDGSTYQVSVWELGLSGNSAGWISGVSNSNTKISAPAGTSTITGQYTLLGTDALDGMIRLVVFKDGAQVGQSEYYDLKVTYTEADVPIRIINSATFTVGGHALVDGGTVVLQSTVALSIDVVVPDDGSAYQVAVQELGVNGNSAGWISGVTNSDTKISAAAGTSTITGQYTLLGTEALKGMIRLVVLKDGVDVGQSEYYNLNITYTESGGYEEIAYYLSSSTGDDSGDGTESNPWKTISKINTVQLSPGSTVNFKRGDTFIGHFVVNGSGNLDQPITITSYGEGEDKAVFSGAVGSAEGGDYLEAILIENNDHIIIEDIEVTNERLVARSGVDSKKAYGIQVLNSGNNILRNFIVRNVNVNNVYAVDPILSPSDFDKLEVTGIRFFNSMNNTNKQTNIQDILVEDCYFTDIQRMGVHFKHGSATTGVGNDSLNRIQDIICRNNEFSYLGGTSILPQQTYNCLIENNIFDHPGADVDERMPARGSSVWTFHCINTVIQYNQCISTRGYFDSHGIHVDHLNKHTYIQYNYMEDCEGGFVEILKGNENTFYRFNVSVNDGWRSYGGADGTWTNSNHTLWISNGANGNASTVLMWPDLTYIYNNTVIMDYEGITDTEKKKTTAIEMAGENTFIYNNIFTSVNGGKMGSQYVNVQTNGSTFNMTHNLFQGDVNTKFSSKDANKITGDPKFIASGEGQEAYQIAEDSPAVEAGIVMEVPAIPNAGYGVFKNVPAYPELDINGNLLNTEKPSIGASTIDKSSGINDHHSQNGKMELFPNPADYQMNVRVKLDNSKPINASLSNVRGQVLNLDLNLLPVSDDMFQINFSDDLSNGLYVLSIVNGNSSYNQRFVLVR